MNRPLCRGCKKEIDPETCGCGGSLQGHSGYEGHQFVPMGCDCLRAPRRSCNRHNDCDAADLNERIYKGRSYASHCHDELL